MVPGYALGACIHHGDRYRFYEATSPAHGPVVVRVHASPVPSERELAATRHAAAVGTRLNAVDGVVAHLDLVPSGRDLALVTAVVDGARPLRSSVGGAGTLVELCRLGASVATVLSALHRVGLVYCALSPDSVLVDPTGGAHLADLERATDVEAETSPLFDPARLGTALTYVSPEQTGRVNRAVDARSDLYCLGLVLFELVAGSPPFTDPSPRALAHAHIARRPPRLDERRPSCPVLLADLVDRLLHKHPEDRYATAAAVAEDLRAIADDIAAGRTPSFALGHHDVEPRLRLSDVLFGRDAELAALREVLDGAAAGGRELAFVSGYSGIGKSRLVNELHRPVAAADAWFATGKFDLYRRDLPYAAFIQAAGELVRQVLTLPETELDALSARLTEELRASAAALGELIPDLALLIGEQEPPGEVSPAEAQRRLEAGIRTLVRVVASVDHPLVLFIDDLQWSDLASLRLLDALIDDVAASALLVIVAWRDNEVGPAHHAWAFVQRHLARAVNLVLEPLGVDDVTEWLAASVHEETHAVADLARLTHDKTLGNPFFVRQFLRDLVTDDVLRIGESGMWSWDTAAVERRGVSENVGDLVSRQVERLPSGVRQVLQAASCVGPEFDLDSVVGIVGGARDDAVASIHAALRAGLILPRDDAYQYASDHAAGINPRFAFLHDRVQEVAHESMRPDVRAAAHLALARRGMAEGDRDPARTDELAVDVASHLSAGISALDDPAERTAAARWLVAGAVRAKAVMATEPAQGFLDHADELLPVERWGTHPDLARRLHTEAADIAYIEGRFADIDRHAAPVLAHTTDPLERMPIHNIHIGIGVAQNRWAEATRYAIDVLADEYGIALPFKPSLAAVAADIAKMRWQLRGWSIDDLRRLPPMTDELVDASMSLLMKTATNAYWASPNLVPLIGLTMVRQSIRHGNSGLSAYGYVLYGLVASAVLFEAERGYRFGELAMEVLDRFGARHLVGKTALVHHGFIRHGVDPMATCGKSVLEGFHEAHAAGDIENAAYCAMAALYTAVVSGEPLPALTERLAPYVDAVRASGHEQTIYGTSVWLQAVDNLTANIIEPELRGEHIDFERRLAELLVSERGNAIPQGVCAAGFLAFLLDDERAERHLGLLFANMRNTPGQAYLMPCLGMYAILLTRKRAARRASPGDRAKLVAITRLLERRAKTNPGDHRPFLDLIAAERAAGAGRLDAAARFLDAAAAAAASGFTYLEGLALERAAALHESRGHAETARHLLSRAVAVWQRYGATARLRLLGHDPTAPHELDSSIDVDTLLDTAAAVSREIEVDGVVAKVLRLAIENAGANRATLLLQGDGKLAVRAAATVSDHGAFDLQMPGPTETAPTGWPARVVDYVARTGADLIVPDASADPRFERDTYIREHRVRSVLCAPLHRAGELTGVLYLENSLGPDVFTARHLTLARTIVGQAAIAIENAGLYERQREMATAFSRFVPRPFLEHLERSSVVEVQLGDAVAADVTILFSDLRDFTSISERLSAADNFELLNSYLAAMDPPVHTNGGFIDKYIGDAVMALFVHAADGAVAAAVEMTGSLRRFNADRDGPQLRMSIGLHAGPVVLGTVGSVQRMDTTVIGDTVNTASRLERLTKPYGAAVLLSGTVRDRLRDPGRFMFREVGRVRAKGKREPVTVHEVLDARGDEMAGLVAALPSFSAGLSAWYAGDFEAAKAGFADAVDIAPVDQLAGTYLHRIDELRIAPADWDGVDRRDSK